MSSSNEMDKNELLFLQLVSMFQLAAMQQMGKLVDPASNEPKRDLDQAKFSIDTIDMLKEKTKGNLSKNEHEFLDKVLFELHMNYVDEVNRPEEPEGKEEKSSGGDKPNGKEEDADGEIEPKDEQKSDES